VPYIVGLGRAASLAENSLTSSVDHLASLRDRLQRQLCEGIGEELIVNAAKADRLPSTLSVNFPRVSASVMLRRIPELCASAGAACHSGLESLSPTLAAIGLTARIARGTMRLSVGWYTTEEEIDRAVNLLVAAWEGAV
jgi:cysteine desulfurase